MLRELYVSLLKLCLHVVLLLYYDNIFETVSLHKALIYHFPSDTGQWYQGSLIYKNLNFSSSSIKNKPQYLYTHDQGLLPTFGNCLGGCSLSNWLITALHFDIYFHTEYL